MSRITNFLLVTAAWLMMANGAAALSYNVYSADTDWYAKYGGGHSLWVPGISTDLQFENGNLIMEDEVWRLTGTARHGALAFDVDLTYTGVSDWTSNPKRELRHWAYADNWDNGPVDTSTWIYAGAIEGTLEGVEGSWYQGSVLSVTGLGGPAQFGYGANGRNVNLGLSNWIALEVTNPGTGATWEDTSFVGDINVDAHPVPEPSAALVFALGTVITAQRVRRANRR